MIEIAIIPLNKFLFDLHLLNISKEFNLHLLKWDLIIFLNIRH